MNGNIDNLINILTIVLVGLIVVFFIVIFIYVYISLKDVNKDKRKNENTNGEEKNNTKKNTTSMTYEKESVMDFMEFEKIEDNMIIKNNSTRFIMVVECKGINYDLISNDEKVAVENGFIQFLNSLRHPIQLYVQTRKVNLEDNINNYNIRFKDIERKYLKEKVDYEVAKRNDKSSDMEVMKRSLEYKKATNLYEYASDIIQNTKNMSFNKNILSKKYYIVLSYSPADEIISGTYDKSEYEERAFTELYTRAKSTISILGATGVQGKILDSYELAELLYMAYNKEQAEIYGIDKIIESRYTDLYITAQDILEKKEKILDEKIEKEASMLVDRAVHDLRSEKERKILKKQEEFDDLVKQMAKAIIVGKENPADDEDIQKLVSIIDDMEVENTVKEEKTNEKAKETRRTRTRARSTIRKQ